MSSAATALQGPQPNALPAASHLDRLEAESIHILREVAAEFDTR